MPEAFRDDYPQNPYRVDPIYTRMTLPRDSNDNRFGFPSVQDLFGELSVTSQFKVTLYLGDTFPSTDSDRDINAWLVSCGVLGSELFNGNNAYLNSLRYEFMCNETSLPGSSFSMLEEVGSRQGVVERFPNRREFPDISMTFYVDAEYGIIRLFEEWLNFINPLYNQYGRATKGTSRGGVERFNDWEFFRFRYPNTYKRGLAITKFERDTHMSPMKDVVRTPSMLTYYFVNAFPTQLTALPVTYEGSTITKTTVTFNYDRYVILNHQGTGKAEFQQPEPTSSSATLPEWAQSQSQPSLLANPSFSWGSDSSIPFQPL
jgi:hypothetical protein